MKGKFYKVFFGVQILALGLYLSGPTSALADAPVTLRETVAISLAYSPNVKAFQEYRQAAVHDLQRARSGWFPRVDARAGWGIEQWSDTSTRRGGLNNPGGDTSRDYYSRSEASLTVSQTIWDGLATLRRVEIGETRLDSAQSRLYDNAEGMALDAVLAHIEIYRQRRIVALAELNVKNHKSILASQFERHKSGASTMADVTQTQSRLARTEASLTESRAALEVAVSNYKRISGRDPGQVAAPNAPTEAYPNLEAALIATQAGNLKIRASQSDIKTALSQASLDTSAFHPQVNLEAGPTYSYRSGSSLDDQGGMVIMLRASWNLFNGGYDYYNVKGDLARARQNKQELEQLKDQLTSETESTWTQFVSSSEQSRQFANAVDYSTKTRNMYLEQFNVGQRSLLDVLDSENELFSYSIQLVTAQLNVIAAQYRLLTLGGNIMANLGINRQVLPIDIDVTEPDRPNIRK
ncbi:MAG: TolC family outer membrane protein [Desulfovibrio sp.]|jgi:adhesin transport system outer membrane protein|nr:TolC family outer membrane protein [Desulfovibrio sp.]